MSLIDDIQLIEEVKRYPLLYDNKFRGYNSTKEKAWITIAAKLNVKPTEAKSRWRSLRDRFVREKKLISTACDLDQKSRSGPQMGPWPLLDHMSFIWDYIVHRRRFTTNSIKKELTSYSSIASQKSLNNSTKWIIPLSCDNISGHNNIVQSNGEQDDCKLKKQTEQILQYQEQPIEEEPDFCHISEDEQSYSQKMDHCLNSQSYVADEEHYFCMSVAETLRRFTSRQRAEAKLKIQQILYDTEFGSDSAENVTTYEDTFMEGN